VLARVSGTFVPVFPKKDMRQRKKLEGNRIQSIGMQSSAGTAPHHRADFGHGHPNEPVTRTLG
jgi:hypothetical protein